MSRFLNALHSGRVLLMDGAMGTELRRAGLGAEECGELWNLSHPERVRAIAQAYVRAGADCLLTNTFQAGPALARHGAVHQLAEATRAAVDIALSAAGPGRFVLGDIGPVSPEVRSWRDDDTRFLQPLIAALGTADGLLFETCADPSVMFAVDHCRAILHDPALPVLVSGTFQHNPKGELRSPSGHRPEMWAIGATNLSVTALGINCGPEFGLDEVIDVVRRYRDYTDVPLFARPNAGTPARAGDGWGYPRTPSQMADRLPELLEAGVALVGGCCGTTPEHIAAFRPVIDAWNARHVPGTSQP